MEGEKEKPASNACVSTCAAVRVQACAAEFLPAPNVLAAKCGQLPGLMVGELVSGHARST